MHAANHLKMAHQCDHASDPLPLPALITCRIRHPALFWDLEIYKLSTDNMTISVVNID